MKKEIILKTSEINEILSAPPSWISRWGLFILCMVLLLSFSLTYFIKFPDTISCKIIITKLDSLPGVLNKEQKLNVQLILPSLKASKVVLGQRVNIKLYEYPYIEYGIISGVIKDISSSKSDSNYKVEIDLPKGLTTSHNKTIQSNSNVMIGIGDIQANDLSLLDRLINKLKRNNSM